MSVSQLQKNAKLLDEFC